MTSKMDALALEFNHLLVSQLDSQRHYYEGRPHNQISWATTTCLSCALHNCPDRQRGMCSKSWRHRACTS